MNRFATMVLAAACAVTMYGQGGRGGGGPVTLASNIKQSYTAMKNNDHRGRRPDAGAGLWFPAGG